MIVPKITMASMLALLAMLAASPASAGDTALEALAVQMATTPEQHGAVAEYYHARAKEAREAAESHRSMAKRYAGGKYVQKKAMNEHCAKLAASFDALAAQYEDLAAAHEAEAK